MRGFLLLAAAGVSTCACAPAQAKPGNEGPRSIQLSKVILDTETNEIKGKLKGGTLCVFPSKLPITKEKKSENYERYDQVFSEKLRASGYNVLTTSADLFATDDDKNKADFLIGATVRPDTLSICSSVNGMKGDVTLSIEWQIYDRTAKKVVLTTSTTGHGAQEKFARDGLKGMWDQAFLEALDTLTRLDSFKAYFGGPKS
jgi:hypothetical protein